MLQRRYPILLKSFEILKRKYHNPLQAQLP